MMMRKTHDYDDDDGSGFGTIAVARAMLAIWPAIPSDSITFSSFSLGMYQFEPKYWRHISQDAWRCFSFSSGAFTKGDFDFIFKFGHIAFFGTIPTENLRMPRN